MPLATIQILYKQQSEEELQNRKDSGKNDKKLKIVDKNIEL